MSRGGKFFPLTSLFLAPTVIVVPIAAIGNFDMLTKTLNMTLTMFLKVNSQILISTGEMCVITKKVQFESNLLDHLVLGIMFAI